MTHDRNESTALLERARGGDREALDEIFARYGERLLAIVRLRLGRNLRRRVESRDVLQDVLLKACERLDQFDGEAAASFMGWLARIAENEVRDQAAFHHRQRRDAGREVALADHPRTAAGVAEAIRSATSCLVLEERTRSLEEALESLGEEHREVILRRRFEEMSFREIGEVLGKSPDACRMLYARAMAALTIRMQSEKEGPP